jgi:hypothetical protein
MTKIGGVHTVVSKINNLFHANTTRGSRVLYYLIDNNNISNTKNTTCFDPFWGHYQVLQRDKII